MSLLYFGAEVAKLLRAVREVWIITYLAKDLVHASDLPLLPRDEPNVDADLNRIRKGKSFGAHFPEPRSHDPGL
jgi:hypothetical protein